MQLGGAKIEKLKKQATQTALMENSLMHIDGKLLS